VVTTGTLFADIVFGGLRALPSLGQEVTAEAMTIAPGGGPAICGIALARLGVAVACCARLGGDVFGSMILTALAQEAVLTEAVSVSPAETTNLTVALSVGQERAFVTHRGTRVTHTDEEVSQALAQWHPSALFVGGLVLSETILRDARARGVVIVLDIGWEIALHQPDALRRLLPLVDYFMPNEAEALAVTGATSVEIAITELRKHVETVVVKCGRRGAVGANPKGTVSVPTFSAETVDTTGAGHAFDGGFLYGLLQGWDLKQCLRAGNACGALSTTRYGAVAGLPRTSEFATLLEFGDQRDRGQRGGMRDGNADDDEGV
jgi:sugar/nucleoside kinase (ribokinase family)